MILCTENRRDHAEVKDCLAKIDKHLAIAAERTIIADERRDAVHKRLESIEKGRKPRSSKFFDALETHWGKALGTASTAFAVGITGWVWALIQSIRELKLILLYNP